MTAERMLIDDLVMVGRAGPDRLSDGRTTICAAGSFSHSRIHPPLSNDFDFPIEAVEHCVGACRTKPAGHPARELENRGLKGEWDHLDQKIRVTGKLSQDEKIRLIPTLVSPCVVQLNESHVSLGIIKPRDLRGYLSERSDVDSSIQLTLFGTPTPKTKGSYRLQPRLEYRCGQCTSVGAHDQQLIEIGCYEWFRKYPGMEAQVFDNLRIADPDYEKYLLVGNQAHHRASYLVIGIIRWKRAMAE